MTDDDELRELERIESLPLDERVEAYRAAQRRLQQRLEQPHRAVGA